MIAATIPELHARASAALARIARESSIALPKGVQGLRLIPCRAPSPPPYGTRIGTWAEAESFLREWALEGREWVNIGLHVSVTGEAYLCYEVPDRGTVGEPLDRGFAPSINFNGPLFDRERGRTAPAAGPSELGRDAF